MAKVKPQKRLENHIMKCNICIGCILSFEGPRAAMCQTGKKLFDQAGRPNHV